jgi:two-component system chemotaxis response regulator CheY/two-component system response regulator (stage 0 sporulation protein A)
MMMKNESLKQITIKLEKFLAGKKLAYGNIDMISQNSFSQITTIIIDDDKDITAVFAEYLKSHGITTLGIGHDGKSAVELYQKTKPSVVFLDVMMPDYDGFYGLEKIKQFDLNARIIMVTADVTQETHDRLMSLGASMIIHKPFEIEEIIMMINRITQLEVMNN